MHMKCKDKYSLQSKSGMKDVVMSDKNATRKKSGVLSLEERGT